MLRVKDDKKLIEKGCEVLIEELGLSGFVRFVKLMGWAEGNWTEERKEALEELEERLLGMSSEEVVEFFSRGRKTHPGQMVI